MHSHAWQLKICINCTYWQLRLGDSQMLKATEGCTHMLHGQAFTALLQLVLH